MKIVNFKSAHSVKTDLFDLDEKSFDVQLQLHPGPLKCSGFSYARFELCVALLDPQRKLLLQVLNLFRANVALSALVLLSPEGGLAGGGRQLSLDLRAQHLFLVQPFLELGDLLQQGSVVADDFGAGTRLGVEVRLPRL